MELTKTEAAMCDAVMRGLPFDPQSVLAEADEDKRKAAVTMPREAGWHLSCHGMLRSVGRTISCDASCSTRRSC